MLGSGDVLWFTNAGGSTISQGYDLGLMDGPNQVAIDGLGNVWVTSTIANNISKLWTSGSTTITGGGVGVPYKIAIDGGGNAWVSSETNQCIVEFSNSGTPLSGASGYRIGDLVTILGVAIDGSGDVWTTHGSSSVNEIIGAAVPVVTPLSVGVKNNMLGTRP